MRGTFSKFVMPKIEEEKDDNESKESEGTGPDQDVHSETRRQQQNRGERPDDAGLPEQFTRSDGYDEHGEGTPDDSASQDDPNSGKAKRAARRRRDVHTKKADGPKATPVLLEPAVAVAHFASTVDGQPASHEVNVECCTVTINGQPAEIEDILPGDLVEFSGRPATSITVIRTPQANQPNPTASQQQAAKDRQQRQDDSSGMSGTPMSRNWDRDPGRPNETEEEKRARESRQGHDDPVGELAVSQGTDQSGIESQPEEKAPELVLVKVDGSTVICKKGNSTQYKAIAPNGCVTLNGSSAALHELKEGDGLEFEGDPATSVKATRK